METRVSGGSMDLYTFTFARINHPMVITKPKKEGPSKELLVEKEAREGTLPDETTILSETHVATPSTHQPANGNNQT